MVPRHRHRSCPVPSTEHRVPSTEYRVPSTEYRAPSTEYRVPSTEYRVIGGAGQDIGSWVGSPSGCRMVCILGDYYGLSSSSTGYGGDSPLWLGHLLVLLTPYCLFVIGLLMVGFLLMRGRRLRGSLFYIYVAFGVVEWDRFWGIRGGLGERSPIWVIPGVGGSHRGGR
jgi:hypothetical protein